MSSDERVHRSLRSNSQSDSAKPTCSTGKSDILTINVFQEMLADALKKQKEDIIMSVTSELKKELVSMRQEIALLKSENISLRNAVCSQQKAIMRLERRDRKNNLLGLGLPELSNSSNDEEQVNALFASVYSGYSVDAVKNFYRLGKPNPNKPRPIKIVFKCAQTRYNILFRAKSLRSRDKYKNIWIKSDLCDLERLENKRIYTVFDELRSSNPGKDVKLSRGVVTVDGDIVDRRNHLRSLFRD